MLKATLYLILCKISFLHLFSTNTLRRSKLFVRIFRGIYNTFGKTTTVSIHDRYSVFIFADWFMRQNRSNVLFAECRIHKKSRGRPHSHVCDFTLLTLSVLRHRSTSLKTSFVASIARKFIFNAIKSDAFSFFSFFLNDKKYVSWAARWLWLNACIRQYRTDGPTNKSHAIPVKLSKPIATCVFVCAIKFDSNICQIVGKS